MSWNVVLGIISTVTIFVPAAIIVVRRLYCHKSFVALFVYYILGVFYNLHTENFITLDPAIARKIGIAINLLDTPLMLSFLLFFSATASIARTIKIFIGVFVLFELTIIISFGFTKEAITYIMGPGILLTVILSCI